MYKIMNAYMSKVQLQTGPELQQRLCDIVNSIKEIKSFSVTEHFKQFAIDMKLESFSVDRAAAVFQIRKSTRLNSSHLARSRMPSSA